MNESENEIQLESNYEGNVQQGIIKDAQSVIERYEALYKIIEKRNRFKKQFYEEEINFLSEQVIQPFETEIKDCSSLTILLDSNLLKLPLEYLKLDGEPISLLKPITFKFDTKPFKKTSINLEGGTIVANKNCDPQFGCRTVHTYFPKTSYYSSKEIGPASLNEQEQDLLIISAHGFSDGKKQGALGWERVQLQKEMLAKINPTMCYFDSCQQGVNWNYIRTLYNNGSLNYYLGPIVSNDSGDSSTKNVERFFSRIRDGKSPAQSLLETKQSMYKGYKKRRPIVRESKSLCFRLYEI